MSRKKGQNVRRRSGTSQKVVSRNPIEDILASLGIHGKDARYVQNGIFIVLGYLVIGLLIEGLELVL